ncbi:hypothetical protein QBC33DRAFT_586453 [Phialemonium atrogriseum]|uniref:Uncharacterized protein n=1 Tax=Phialemonium atrogriseum TaxID=1093897 RepID=A0AAJ0C1E2_9PEZI|nr:uncharacterized protein QBC33DRAFT_586453 [Phialemonium atrogriseum]KAK1767328.1 hypothetical protein QBC33DRAFT_586453 [Phialemonium atrogriseum]
MNWPSRNADWSTYLGTGGRPWAGSRYYSDAYKNRNHLGKVVSGQIYTLTSPASPDLGRFAPPLMTVNFEARRMALEFYYIMIPAKTRTNPTIYLNPTYDPKGVGLAHWVVSPTVLEKIEAHGCRWLKDWPMPDHGAMADILRSQKSIIFTHKKLPQGQLSYCENFPFDELYLNLPRATTTSDLLETDLRPGVPESLATMWMDADPLDLMDVFRSLLRHIDAHASAHAAATRAARAAGQPFIMPDPKRRRKSRKGHLGGMGLYDLSACKPRLGVFL